MEGGRETSLPKADIRAGSKAAPNPRGAWQFLLWAAKSKCRAIHGAAISTPRTGLEEVLGDFA